MALPDPSAVLERLNLNDAATEPIEHLPFRPSGEFAWIQNRLTNIDRYLFRISDRRSDGVTNMTLVQSRDAFYSRPIAFVDIFAREDHEAVAEMLNRHLRWNYDRSKKDNTVSWTSSLLFALQYCLYRNVTDKSPLEDLKICVVDTMGLPEGVFVRDLELLNAYADDNSDLADLRDLRTNRCRGIYYFGEYLSQGSLRIESHCSIVSIKDIIDKGLDSFQPGFKGFERRLASRANEVIKLRQIFHHSESQLAAIDDETVETAMTIGGLFGPRWKLPMAVSFMSLRPWPDPDEPILKAIEAHEFTGISCPRQFFVQLRLTFLDVDRVNVSPALTNTIAPASMPELA